MRPGGGDEGRGQADLPGDVYGLSRAHNLQALTRLCSRHSELADRITASPEVIAVWSLRVQVVRVIARHFPRPNFLHFSSRADRHSWSPPYPCPIGKHSAVANADGQDMQRQLHASCVCIEDTRRKCPVSSNRCEALCLYQSRLPRPPHW